VDVCGVDLFFFFECWLVYKYETAKKLEIEKNLTTASWTSFSKSSKKACTSPRSKSPSSSSPPSILCLLRWPWSRAHCASFDAGIGTGDDGGDDDVDGDCDDGDGSVAVVGGCGGGGGIRKGRQLLLLGQAWLLLEIVMNFAPQNRRYV